jgi:hypothetical protein
VSIQGQKACYYVLDTTGYWAGVFFSEVTCIVPCFSLMAEQANKVLHSHSPEKQTAVAANGSCPSFIHSANAHALFTAPAEDDDFTRGQVIRDSTQGSLSP